MVDQNAPHQRTGYAEEMVAAQPVHVLPEQAEVGLVHQRGGAEGVARSFAAEESRGALFQTAVDQGNQVVAGVEVTLPPKAEVACDVAWQNDAPEKGREW